MFQKEKPSEDDRAKYDHVVQATLGLRNLRYTRSMTLNADNLKRLDIMISNLENELRKSISVLGGRQTIDEWLSKNDPGNTQLKDIEIDWSFLQK